MLMRILIFALGVLSILLWGCKKNGFEQNPHPNKAPKTYMVVDTINRSGNNRYNSQVKVQWWGKDEDGFIKGYKISTDLVHWVNTNRQDSIFNLLLPQGKDTFDFRFYVKAIDNAGLEDASYASLAYPVKNSTPSISFIIPSGTSGIITKNPMRSLPVIKYSWVATDPDGSQDLHHIDICLNDTMQAPYQVNSNISDLTFLAELPTTNITTCKVFTGQSSVPLAATINNMMTNKINYIYIRSVDQVGSKSAYIASNPIYIKKVNSDILLINAIASSSQNIAIQTFYCNQLALQNKVIIDTLQALEIINNNYTELSVDNLTQSRILAMYKHIVWVTDDANYSLSFGQKITGEFFKSGGTMLMSVAFSNNWDTTSSWLDFTPIKALVPQKNGQTFRMVDQSLVTNVAAGWPVLKFVTAGAPIVRPIFKFDDNGSFTYQYLYNSTIKITGGGPSYDWASVDSTNVVVAKKTASNGKTNFIFSSIPLEKLNGNSNIDLFFKKVLIDELSF